MGPEDFSRALGGRSFREKVIPVSALVFRSEFARSCRACVNFNTRWNCPPAIPPMEEQREKIQGYGGAFVFSTKYDLESPFDFDGMFFRALIAHQTLTSEMFQRFGPAHPVYGAGSCYFCKECARPGPCCFPEKRVSSIEAAGIDVTALSRAAGMGYNNGDSTVTYFSMILFGEALGEGV